MTITEFCDQLALLSLEAPTQEIAELALSLQTSIDLLDHDDYDTLYELFG